MAHLSLAVDQEYPVSLGSVHIKSGEDANIAPDFDPGFLTESVFLSNRYCMLFAESLLPIC
jgi:hypothetical protein